MTAHVIAICAPLGARQHTSIVCVDLCSHCGRRVQVARSTYETEATCGRRFVFVCTGCAASSLAGATRILTSDAQAREINGGFDVVRQVGEMYGLPVFNLDEEN